MTTIYPEEIKRIDIGTGFVNLVVKQFDHDIRDWKEVNITFAIYTKNDLL